MNIFNKISLCIIIMLILSLESSAKKLRGDYATKNLKGQEYYLNNCSSCHGDGNRGGNMSSIREWKIMFDNKAEELIYLHEEDENNSDLLRYLKSDNFKKQSKLMLEFLQEFAYDSEHIPTCN